ncbi:BTAD domain-containing putative transcriptional regulator [Actinophytocola sp.]|uniref:AfsR/SARP family transcriptional regulator n=1 Tax=Actinophytocola sp. TaxID=1872138 RepID=UPI00389A90B0
MNRRDATNGRRTSTMAGSAVRYAILGPVEVHANAGPVPLGGPRAQSVLAALLLSANSVVSVDTVVDMVWGERPPHTGRRQVQNHVSAFRLALRGARIETHPNGYRLLLEPDDLDALVFERAAPDVRGLLAQGRAREAASCARTALALWRGPALAGTSGPALTDEATRLTELRLDVETLRFEAELALGRHDDVISELTALTRAHPVRERLVRHLMTALYRAGRKADALAVCDASRRLLADQFGLEPVPELLELRQAILVDSTELGVARPTGTVSRPRQLPPPVPDFVGRVGEQARLTRILTERRAAVVTGGPGIGKSALAARVAGALADRFPGGQLYLSAGARTAPGELLSDALTALGVRPAGMAARAGQYRAILADRPTLIVIDDVVDADQVRPLLPGAGNSALLATSARALLAVEGAEVVSLSRLSEAEELTLLGFGGREARRTVRMCAGNLAALRAARVLLDRFPGATSLSEDRWLSALSLVDEEVRRGLRRRYDLLAERTRSAFRGLAVTPAIRLSGLEPLELADVGLVDEAGEVGLLARCLAAELSEVD